MTGPHDPIRALIDTNIFISGLIVNGIPAQVLQRWRAGEFRLLTTEEQIDELQAVLGRDHLFRRYGVSADERRLFLTWFVSATEIVPARYPLPIAISDPKDAFLLAGALGGKADYLVSGDAAHILPLNGRPELGQLAIVAPRVFLDLLSTR